MDLSTGFIIHYENESSDEDEWNYVEGNFHPISFRESKCTYIAITLFFVLIKLNFTQTEILIINEKMKQGCIYLHELESLGFDRDKIEALVYLVNPKYFLSNFTEEIEMLILDHKDILRIKKCAICSENFFVGNDVYSLTCIHFCHKHCLIKRTRKYVSCPICHATYEKYPKLIQNYINSDPEAMTFLYKILHRVSRLVSINNSLMNPFGQKNV